MDNIFEQIFRYGFHDTDLTSILCENGQISLSFNNGIYILDENGKEEKLSKALQIVLEIDTSFYSLDQLLEIKEYGNKVKYLNYSSLKKYFNKEPYGICMAYY